MQFSRHDHRFHFAGTATGAIRVLDMVGGPGPLVGVTCGVHGDEMDTAAVIREVRQLADTACPAGTLRVVFGLNPLAVLERSRAAAHDQRDLNRRFTSDSPGSYARAVADAVLEVLSGADVVMNLHQFETDAPMTAAYWDLGTEEVRRRQWATLGVLEAPVVIWAAPDTDTAYAPFADCVDAMMCRRGIPAILVESSRFLADDASQISLIARGILRMWSAASRAPDLSVQVTPVVRRRTRIDPPGHGVFRSRGLSLPAHVDAGDVLGSWVDFESLDEVTVTAPHDGLLTQLRHGGHVRPQDYLGIVCLVEALSPDFAE